MCHFTIKTQLARVTRFVVTAIAPVFLQSRFEITQSSNRSHGESNATDPDTIAIAPRHEIVQTNDNTNVLTSVSTDTRTNTDTYTGTIPDSTDVLTCVRNSLVTFSTRVYTSAIAGIETATIPTSYGIVTGSFVLMTVAALAHVTVRGLAAIARKHSESRSVKSGPRAIAR